MYVEDDLTDKDDWQKVSEKQAITFRDCTHCDNDVRTAVLSVEETCDAASTGKGMREIGGATSSNIWGGSCWLSDSAMDRTSFKTDDASMQ
jgi:hypothetical protein